MRQVTDVTDNSFLFRNKYKNIRKRARRFRVIPRNVAQFFTVHRFIGCTLKKITQPTDNNT